MSLTGIESGTFYSVVFLKFVIVLVVVLVVLIILIIRVVSFTKIH